MVTFIMVTAVMLTAACVAIWALILGVIAMAAVNGLRDLAEKCTGS